MLSKIIKLDQSFDISLGHVTNYIVMQLQNGSVIRAEVGDDEYNHILEAVGMMEHEAQAPLPEVGDEEVLEFTPADEEKAPYDLESAGEVAPPGEEDLAEPEIEDEVNWRELGNDVLSPYMRKILEEIDLPDVVPFSTLEAVVSAVAEQEPEEGNGAAKPSVLMSDSGPPRNVPPIRSVDKDEMGYPRGVPQRAPIASGEDLDEDGVGQL